MLKVHELRVSIDKDTITTRFYQKRRGGPRLVGVCVSDKKDKDATRAAIAAEYGFALEGQGKREM